MATAGVKIHPGPEAKDKQCSSGQGSVGVLCTQGCLVVIFNPCLNFHFPCGEGNLGFPVDFQLPCVLPCAQRGEVLGRPLLESSSGLLCST